MRWKYQVLIRQRCHARNRNWQPHLCASHSSGSSRVEGSHHVGKLCHHRSVFTAANHISSPAYLCLGRLEACPELCYALLYGRDLQMRCTSTLCKNHPIVAQPAPRRWCCVTSSIKSL